MSVPFRAALALLVAATSTFPAVASAALTVDGKPKVSFFATGSPGFLSIEGVTSTMTLADDGARLTFTVPMETVSSGIALRDEHMNKNYVQIDQYPNVVLDFAKAEVTWPTDGKAVEGTVNANVTFHGVTRPTVITYTITPTKSGFKVKGKFDYDVSQHGITIEPYMGVSFDHKMYATVVVDLVDAP